MAVSLASWQCQRIVWLLGLDEVEPKQSEFGCIELQLSNLTQQNQTMQLIRNAKLNGEINPLAIAIKANS